MILIYLFFLDPFLKSCQHYMLHTCSKWPKYCYRVTKNKVYVKDHRSLKVTWDDVAVKFSTLITSSTILKNKVTNVASSHLRMLTIVSVLYITI